MRAAKLRLRVIGFAGLPMSALCTCVTRSDIAYLGVAGPSGNTQADARPEACQRREQDADPFTYGLLDKGRQHNAGEERA